MLPDTGVPVANAQVAIQDCGGKVYFRGPTDAQGRARIAAVMPERERLPACLTGHDRQLVASARAGEDLSFVMSEWNEGLHVRCRGRPAEEGRDPAPGFE